MHKRILLPVDGSQLSLDAALEGIEWARTSGAQVVALFVGTPFTLPISYAETVPL